MCDTPDQAARYNILCLYKLLGFIYDRALAHLHSKDVLYNSEEQTS
jgi:hypothetical protein